MLLYYHGYGNVFIEEGTSYRREIGCSIDPKRPRRQPEYVKRSDMASHATMLDIADSFIKLTETKPPEKISVSDIIAAADKNRKTFYYHFNDKTQLIVWIFRHDLAKRLIARFDESQLVYETDSDSPCRNLPYYVFVKRGVRALEGSVFFEELAACLESRRTYYARILGMSDQGNLSEYLYRLYTPALRCDVEFVLSNRQLRRESIDFLAEFYADAFITFMIRRCRNLSVKRIMTGSEPFANILHSSLENEIKEQQLQRRM